MINNAIFYVFRPLLHTKMLSYFRVHKGDTETKVKAEILVFTPLYDAKVNPCLVNALFNLEIIALQKVLVENMKEEKTLE